MDEGSCGNELQEANESIHRTKRLGVTCNKNNLGPVGPHKQLFAHAGCGTLRLLILRPVLLRVKLMDLALVFWIAEFDEKTNLFCVEAGSKALDRHGRSPRDMPSWKRTEKYLELQEHAQKSAKVTETNNPIALTTRS